MKKTIIFLGLVVVAWVGWYVVSPFFIDIHVNEEAPIGTYQVVSEGTFTGFDRIHTGTGTARIIQVDNNRILRFEDDFNVNNGPDLYVGFGNNGQYIKGSELAVLKGNIGAQNYELPIDFDLEKYNEVWIWCKQFSEPFARAVLQ